MSGYDGILTIVGGIPACLWHWIKSWNDGIPSSGCVCIYYIYTPNLGLATNVFVREWEQGCSRGSTEGARGSMGEHGGAWGNNRGACKKWPVPAVCTVPSLASIA